MSLINEALKRIESQGPHHAPPGAPSRPAATNPAHGHRPWPVLILLMVVVATLALVALKMYWPGGGESTPTASAVSPTKNSQNAEKQTAKEESQPPPHETQANRRDQSQNPAQRDPIIEKTLNAVNYFSRPENDVALDESNIVSKTPPQEPPRDDAPSEGAPTPNASAEQPAYKDAAGKSDNAPKKPHPGDFKLNGIMQGPAGATAIINGRHLSIGQEINGAKVVAIRQYEVTLQAGSEKFTIGM